MDLLFTRFGKLQRTAKINSEGLGLGLTIVKQIVESAGGQVIVDSEGVNQGSTFTVQMKMETVSLLLDQGSSNSSLLLRDPVLQGKSDDFNLAPESIKQEANELMDDNSIEKSMSKADDCQVMLSSCSPTIKKELDYNCQMQFNAEADFEPITLRNI